MANKKINKLFCWVFFWVILPGIVSLVLLSADAAQTKGEPEILTRVQMKALTGTCCDCGYCTGATCDCSESDRKSCAGDCCSADEDGPCEWCEAAGSDNDTEECGGSDDFCGCSDFTYCMPGEGLCNICDQDTSNTPCNGVSDCSDGDSCDSECPGDGTCSNICKNKSNVCDTDNCADGTGCAADCPKDGTGDTCEVCDTVSQGSTGCHEAECNDNDSNCGMTKCINNGSPYTCDDNQHCSDNADWSADCDAGTWCCYGCTGSGKVLNGCGSPGSGWEWCLPGDTKCRCGPSDCGATTGTCSCTGAGPCGGGGANTCGTYYCLKGSKTCSNTTCVDDGANCLCQRYSPDWCSTNPQVCNSEGACGRTQCKAQTP